MFIANDQHCTYNNETYANHSMTIQEKSIVSKKILSHTAHPHGQERKLSPT